MCRCRLILLVFLYFLLTIAVVSADAFSSDDIKIQSGWAVAGGGAVSITVHVENITIDALENDYNGYIENATVTILSYNSTMGTISTPHSRRTESNGNISPGFTFIPNTIKGDAEIQFFIEKIIDGISYNGTTTYSQKIDHATPRYFSKIQYKNPVDIDSTTSNFSQIIVILVDQYHNSVDNDREISEGKEPEKITFIGPDNLDGYFMPGSSYSVPITVDSEGNFSVKYFVPTKSGDNVITIIAPQSVISNSTNRNYEWITITGIATIPSFITQTITSFTDRDLVSPHTAIANSSDKFSIYYTVFDIYGNPVPNIILTWKPSDGNSLDFKTNHNGLIFLEYGPSDTLKTIILTVNNGSISNSSTVQFISGQPIYLDLTANPLILASRDANSASTAYLYVKLMDVSGLPIKNQPISFVIKNEQSSIQLKMNSSFDPILNDTQDTQFTNDQGIAKAILYPGEFPKGKSASGNVTIQASWKTLNSPEVLVTYKNYPFLRAETEVSSALVKINETVNVTIRLIGDGYAPYKPIDIILVTHRGESIFGDMYEFESGGQLNDKMFWLREAAKNVTLHLRPDIFGEIGDGFGIVSFGINGTSSIPETKKGWGQSPGVLPGRDNGGDADIQYYINNFYNSTIRTPSYYDHATVDTAPSPDANDEAKGQSLLYLDQLLDAPEYIDKITPSKDDGGNYDVPLRYGLYKGVRELNHTDRDSVKAVIVFTDIQWTTAGSPDANWDASKGQVDNKGITLAEKSLRDPPENWAKSGIADWTAFDNARWGVDGWAKIDNLQNLANYAIAAQTRVYVLAYPDQSGNFDNIRERILTDSITIPTGGKFFRADNGSAVDILMQQILEELKQYASVNTRMDANFTNVNVSYNNSWTLHNGSSLFNYEYEKGSSTKIDSWNKTANITTPLLTGNGTCGGLYPADADPKILNNPCNTAYPYSTNQTNQWKSNRLSFYIGNVSIGQTWQAIFRLRANNTPGSFSLFGPGSIIQYYDESLRDYIDVNVPLLYMTILNESILIPEEQSLLDIIDGSIVTTPSNSTELLNITWLLNYTGDYSVRQVAYYQYTNNPNIWSGDWIEFHSDTTKEGPKNHQLYPAFLDVRERRGYVKIKIFSYELRPGGPFDEEETDSIDIGALFRPTILLE